MRRQHAIRFVTILLLLVGLNLTGCIATQTFPLRALPGETVALTIGRTADEVGQGVTKDDLVVTITDANNVHHVIDANSTGSQGTIRALFRSYPDPLVMPMGGPTGQIGAVLDLPTDLAVGPGKVSWQVLNGKLPTYIQYWLLDDYAKDVDLEVLPGGPGSPHQFLEKLTQGSIGALTDLEPGSRIRFHLDTTSNVGALQVQLNRNQNILLGSPIKIDQRYKYRNTHLTQHVVSDNTSPYSNQISVHLLKADGGTKDDFEFYMVWMYKQNSMDLTGLEGVTVDPQDPSMGTLNTNYFKAYDINGNLVADASMTLEVFY